MSASPFEVARLDDLDRFEDDFTTVPIRIPLGIGSFGINAYSAREAGGLVIEAHDELGSGAGRHEELYLVVSGAADFTLDGRDVPAERGTLVFVRDPAVRRKAVAREPDTTVLVVGGVPGQPFTPSPWESWLAALPHYRRGDHARAVEVMRAALDAYPGNPNVLYNLACVEALAGERAGAIDHLRRAIEANPAAREWALADDDFVPIRDDPAFPA